MNAYLAVLAAMFAVAAVALIYVAADAVVAVAVRATAGAPRRVLDLRDES